MRVAGHIDEKGHIEIDQPNMLPFGGVIITIEPINSEFQAVLVTIRRSVQIHPFAFHLDIRFIRSPQVVRQL